MRVLVIGKNSYIASRFITELEYSGYQYEIQSVRDDSWKDLDYSEFTSVVYFAAIVHQPENNDEEIYMNVNASIPYEMALKCQLSGVSQFIYISTCAVWGIDPSFGRDTIIDNKSSVQPKSLYGKSKLKGEQLLLSLNESSFRVAILRLPNVYGDNCPGRFYHRLELLSKLPFLPTINVKPLFSLISVDNVAKTIMKVVETKKNGIICPQDSEVLSIVDRITCMAHKSGRTQHQISILSPLIRLVYKISPNKYFNNLYGGYYINSESFETMTDL